MKHKSRDNSKHPYADWNVPFKIAKRTAHLYWAHAKLYPCDSMGFRIPSGFASFAEKYSQTGDRKRIFCLGGSNTFGLVDSYEQTYPSCLESCLDQVAVFNLGLFGVDSHGFMIILLDLLRLGYVPDIAIFLDGINEKQGWLQALEGSSCYEEISWQYRLLQRVLHDGDIPMTLQWRKNNGVRARLRKLLHEGFDHRKHQVSDPTRFAVAQANSYFKTNRAITALAQTWGIETKFFLEPTAWDCAGEPKNSYHRYFKTLYREIVEQNGSVIDLSQGHSLSGEDFIEWKHLNANGVLKLARAIAKNLPNCRHSFLSS